MTTAPSAAWRHALLEQYFNIHCRENGIPTPPALSPRHAAAMPAELRRRVHDKQLAAFGLPLCRGRSTLVGLLARHSLIGCHALDEMLWLEQDGDWQRLEDPLVLAGLLADHLATCTPLPDPDATRRLKAAIGNSIAHVHRYHREPRAVPDDSPFVRAEQGLRQGHVFHVTSKATDGFDEHDLQRYAPELGARFRLHYFAVQPARHAAIGAPTCEPYALAQARARLPAAAAQWPLLACHPWQAGHLLARPDMSAAIQRGEVLSLGPLGEVAVPGSSVRTVWLPRWGRCLKLALDIRITHFVRNNPAEHVRRALDASAALARLPRAVIDAAHFRVLLETGAQSLATSDPSLLAASTIVHREALEAAEMSRFQVVAALLEPDANAAGQGLHGLLDQAGAGTPPLPALVGAWWRRYLDVTLEPLLDLLLDHGIGLEAHLQNSLVAFEQGWPVRGMARDMEGTTVDRKRAAGLGLPADSPAVYPADEVWRRFQYYVLVNHLGQVAAMLARTDAVGEYALWQDIARRLLRRGDARLAAWCGQPSLPAKANLRSCFASRGERPLWVAIRNPLRRRG